MINKNDIFNGKYYKQQISNYLDLEEKVVGSATLKYVTPKGRLDGYMYKDFLLSGDTVPALYINNEVWMSLTPMEVESHYVPIARAKGKVGVAGLGLGYYVQEILEKEEVESIDVYEINQDVIDMYISNFGVNEKVNIINKDIFEVSGKSYDFFYCDIYLSQMDMSAIKDKGKICSVNSIGDYFFWTQEMFVLCALLNKDRLMAYKLGVSDTHTSNLLSALVEEKENFLMVDCLEGIYEDILLELNY